MKNTILFYLLVVLLGACNQNGKSSAEKKDNTPIVDSNLIGMPVTNVEMEDDSVFADGSRPSSWENAGITKVYALKIFIKDLQYMVANDNREEIAKLVRYPLNKTIQTKADFLANYDKIITPGVKEDMANVNMRQLFRNHKGVMIGNGTIWITQEDKDFKIIAINN